MNVRFWVLCFFRALLRKAGGEALRAMLALVPLIDGISIVE